MHHLEKLPKAHMPSELVSKDFFTKATEDEELITDLKEEIRLLKRVIVGAIVFAAIVVLISLFLYN